jgi:hypothetical protein
VEHVLCNVASQGTISLCKVGESGAVYVAGHYNGGDRRGQLIARNQAGSGDGRLINDRESFEEKVDKEVLR